MNISWSHKKMYLKKKKRCISIWRVWRASKLAQVASTGDGGSTPTSPGGENGNPFQYSCLGNAMDRGAGQATVMGLQRVRHD